MNRPAAEAVGADSSRPLPIYRPAPVAWRVGENS